MFDGFGGFDGFFPPPMATDNGPRETDSGGVKQGRFVILCFPCFTVFRGLKIPRYWEKQHEKCRCHTPFCAPQMLVKTRT